MIKAVKTNLRYNFTSMEEWYFKQPDETAVIFGPSKRAWTYRDIVTQAKALAKGLSDVNFIKDDVVVVKLPYDNMEESLVTRIAVASLEGKLIPSKATTIRQLQKQFRITKARAFVFSSYDTIEETNYADALYRILPQMVHAPYNSEIFPRNLRYMRFLIQTDNYKYKGTLNYNRLMKFVSDPQYILGFECREKLIKIQEISDNSPRPIVLTNPCEEIAFRAGVLNCLTNGKTLFCVKPSQAKLISEQYQHQIDVICTEPLEELHRDNRVFVESGSKLYQRHPNRIELVL